MAPSAQDPMAVWTHGGNANSDLFSALLDRSDLSDLKSIVGGFAFVSLSGAMHLRNVLQSDARLLACKKTLMIGISQGITEPQAVRILRDIPNTSAKLFTPQKKVTYESLFSPPVFHPKFLFVESKNLNDCWMIGSANLTGAAIGLQGKNIELASIANLTGNPAKQRRQQLEEWMSAFAGLLRPATDPLLAAYSEARLDAFKTNPALLAATEPSSDLSLASELFVEVGAASGIARHQVEFNRHLATFFGKPSKKRRDYVLTDGHTSWSGRPLTPKTTSFGVEIYRLGMPTTTKGGEPIAGRAIHFKRTKNPRKFEFDVTDLGSNAYESWFGQANQYGHVGSTSGGRRFGYIF
ncbi:hypothetical protein LZ016_07290 [Sphingomonas sp. SM33]|uniref:PLD phosphodiesterase domain-containing protein n=1 Tax=Sphingomonas telluris TaxID=2907998 RepID=A0ABS9VND6_9SPHN|nr:hypothetical protein [Sphingomonas telluris]MCH8615902.1 hypothetical protein [Sphingomonas telluris]